MALPNYAYWDLQPIYELLDAAVLCCNQEPEELRANLPSYRQVAAMRKRLMDEVTAIREENEICTMLGVPAQDYRFQRDSLREWAERTRLRAPVSGSR